VNNPLDVKQNNEHALDFALHLSCLFFSLGEFGLFLLVCLRDITLNPALVTSDNPGQEGCILTVPLSDPL
jgi:hypothetical protein